MTEEIIIDGVNVAGCEYYFESTKTVDTCKWFGCKCNSVSTDECKYKQLQRLEQENKALKDNNNYLQAIIDDGREENKRWKQENEKLKKANERLKTLYHNEGITDICDSCSITSAMEAYDYRKALEEIRILATKNVSIENFVKIQNKINEVLK